MLAVGGFHSLLLIVMFAGYLPRPSELEEKTYWSWLQEDESESAKFYREGKDALDRGEWDRAIRAFQKASEDPQRADAALYWIAYAQNKKGDAAPALDTLETLVEEYPDSRWIKDARALELEIRGPSPTPRPRPAPVPEEEEEDLELKLMALNSLMHADEEEAVPMLEEFLRGDHSTRLKERALFVLAQGGSEKALKVVADFARNEKEPELQEKAIRYLGVHGRRESMRLLNELYHTVERPETKKAILHSFMIADEQQRLLQVAKAEKDPELRGAAIHWLGVMNAGDELWQLYRNETSAEIKEKILHALFVGGGRERLLSVAQNRSEPEEVRLQAIHWLGVSDAGDELWQIFQQESSLEVKERILHGLFLSGDVDKLAQVARDGSQPTVLRQAAIHNLGISGKGSRPLLLEIYNGESDPEAKKQVLHSLFIQDGATELVDIARGESDPELKKQAVHWLSLMDSDEAKAFLLEILKK